MPEASRDWQMETERRLSHVETLAATHENWLRDVQTVGREAAEVGRENTLNIRDLTSAVKGLADHQKQQDDVCAECRPIVQQAGKWQWAGGKLAALLTAGGVVGVAIKAVWDWAMQHAASRGVTP